MSKNSDSKERSERGPSGLAKGYLLLYNGFQFVAWSYVFAISTSYLIKDGPNDAQLKQHFKKDVMPALELFQCIAVIESVHAALGLVKTSPVLVFVQQVSRIFIMFGLCEYVPTVWDSQLGLIGIRTFVFCWALSEIIRYSFYVFATLDANHVPGWSKWLRYNVFLVNYPVGVAGEMTTIVATILLLRGPLASVPTYTYNIEFGKSHLEFQYWWFLAALLVPYLPIWWQLYSKLLVQRRRLSAASKNTGASNGKGHGKAKKVE